MTISAGARLGPYEILAAIGAGGMGEVYRANDPRLHRDVAIKIGAAQFSERSAREARLVAALNHPNICHVYDVGPNYLVMELVEGPTLAERLKQGPVPLEEALGIARQIGEALEAAHEKGIVHRDLKPANIKIRPDGTVKVLDFGLAKGAEEAASAENPEISPTLTLEQATRAGSVLGTAAYMAPEQARGKPVDKRADIWAFGVVLYEMLTGQRLFKGETVSDTLAAVLTREPEWTRVPPGTERLLRRCLERDPKQRLRDIGDARFLLEDEPRKAVPAPGSNWRWKISTAALLAIVSVIALVFLWVPARHAAPSVLRLSIDLGDNAALSPRRGAIMALSPDGSRLVYVIGQPIAKSQLAVRRLDQSKSMTLTGTDGAEAPFFSPDAVPAGGAKEATDWFRGSVVSFGRKPALAFG
jgi:serine/threonine protein kinase